MSEQILMSASQIEEAVTAIADAALASVQDGEHFAVIGIQTRGVYLAGRISKAMEKKTGKHIKQGVLDITFYRDDLASRSSLPIIKETRLDFSVDGMTILLVDDVLFTGRTIKAALDTLTDYGRPKKIMLAVLADRGNRELPIQADFAGLRIETCFDDEVNVLLAEKDGADRVVLTEAGQK